MKGEKKKKKKNQNFFKTQKMKGYIQKVRATLTVKIPSIKMYTTINVIANKKQNKTQQVETGSRTKPGQKRWDICKSLLFKTEVVKLGCAYHCWDMRFFRWYSGSSAVQHFIFLNSRSIITKALMK